jgi:ABC-type glycerol-3-phosphate transport system substrate-binding protein
MSKFQIILLVVFGVFIVVAVLLFAFFRGSSRGQAQVLVWGDISAYDFSELMNQAGLNQNKEVLITYEEKRSESLGREFTEAVAENRGPDLILLPVNDLWKEKTKLLLIPFGSISERDFKNTFVEEGELFLTSEGTYALPFSVDPLVLYYNRDLLTKEGIANPISYWDEMYAAAARLTKRDPAGNIVESAIALGEARNIPNSKDILSLLMIQAGTPITTVSNGELQSVIGYNFDFSSIPGETALDFYTQFANPFKPYYSWNRSLLSAQTNFISGDSAFYIGYASELRTLRNKNPTLNIGVSLVPQSRVSGKKITFGKLIGAAIPRSSRNPGAALTAARILISRETSKIYSSLVLLPPARRDLLSEKQPDAVMSVFYDAALQSKGWIDPDKEKTRTIFNEMIESVTSGRAHTLDALNKASTELEDILD